MSEQIKKITPAPESYTPKNKPEILNMMESVKESNLQYPPQYRIKQKSKTAVYTGTGGFIPMPIPRFLRQFRCFTAKNPA